MNKIINGIEIPEKTVVQNLFDLNKDRLNIPGFEYYGNQLTYDEIFNKEIKKYADAFVKLGIKKGDVVTLSMPGIPQFTLSILALESIGAIANGVSIVFLNRNLELYTTEKNSNTLIIFDDFYKYIEPQLKDSKLKNVIFSSAIDYLKDEEKEAAKKQTGDIRDRLILPGNKEYITMEEFINAGNYKNRDLSIPYNNNADSLYLYTSGTTGQPKCVVYGADSNNALISMHKDLDLNEQVGDRSLLIIPPYHPTGLMYGTILQLSKGKTLVFQPKYNKNTFTSDLINLNINHVVAAASHYTVLINSDLEKNALNKLKFPMCGGEPVTYGQSLQINEKMKYLGAGKFILGGGTSELGSGVLATYFMKDSTNETGEPFPGVLIKFIDPETGKDLSKDAKRGEIVISAPCSMKRYLNNEEATNEYFTYDDEGIRWGHPKDIAQKNENGSYTLLGRETDSYVNSEGKRVYLFDTEHIASYDDGVIENEAVALPVGENKYIQVLYLLLNKENKDNEIEIIERLSKIPNIDGIKIIDTFKISPVTDKRDCHCLLDIRDEFYYMDESGKLLKKSFPYNEETIIEEINIDDLRKTNKKLIKTLF